MVNGVRGGLDLDAYANNVLSSGHCITGSFDWATPSGHFDGRI